MSIRKEGKRYVATVEAGKGGKRRRKTKRFDRLADAKRWEMEMENVSKITDIDSYDITFEELAGQWLLHKKNKGVAKSTYAKYENGIRVASRFQFYTKKAREIKMPELETALNSLAQTYTKEYIKDIKGCISAVFTFGIDQDYLIKNPCQRASLPLHSQKGRKIRSFTPEEVAIIEKYKDSVEFGDVVYVMLNTGLRGQEVCCIDKNSISIRDGKPYLTVSRAMTREGGSWRPSDTKTEASERTNPISMEVYQMILRRVLKSPNNLFIDGYKKKYISYTCFRDKVKRFFDTLAEMGEPINYLPPHCDRHTFASRCVWSGVSMAVTKELMGHTSEEMTDKYTDITNRSKEEAIAMLK